eukprot:gene13957-3561_t
MEALLEEKQQAEARRDAVHDEERRRQLQVIDAKVHDKRQQVQRRKDG